MIPIDPAVKQSVSVIEIPTEFPRTVRDMPDRRSKSLPPEQIAAARRFVRELVDKRFGGNIRAAATEVKVSYATLYGLYEGSGGAGNLSLQRLSEFTGQSIDAIIGRETRVVYDVADSPRWKFIPWFAEVVARARELFRLPDEAWEMVGNLMGRDPPPRDPVALGMIAKTWWEAIQRQTPEEVAAEETLRRDAADEDARELARIKRGEKKDELAPPPKKKAAPR